jgi:azurin
MHRKKFVPLSLLRLTLFVVSSTSLTPRSFSEPVLSAKKAPAKPGKPNATVKMLMRDGLRFDPPRFSAEPGQKLVIELENEDSSHQSHNFLLIRPGKLKEIVESAMALGEKGPAQSFVPQSSDILAHSTVLDPEKQSRISVDLPSEPGVYPYVCTMPGHGMVMYGALYLGVTLPAIDKDPNIPPTAVQALLPGGGRRPFIQRMFLPNAGPAAIAVSLPGKQNFCWDAGECRLRYVWSGAGVDPSEHWRGNGKDLAKVPTSPWWSAPIGDFPFRFGSASASAPKVKFLGYRVEAGVPEFHFKVGDVEVFEKVTADDARGVIELHYKVHQSNQAVFYRAADAEGGKWASPVGLFNGGVLELTPAQAAQFSVTLTGPSIH